MKCPEDIKIFTKLRSEQKLFQFLNALDQKYEPIKREILRSDVLPTAEAAYATVRKEEVHKKILGTKDEPSGVAPRLCVTDPGTRSGLVSKGSRRTQPTKPDKTHLKCTHCGMTKHTKEECFRIVGYPDWWNDGHKKGVKGTGQEKGKAAVATGNNHCATGVDNDSGSFAGIQHRNERKKMGSLLSQDIGTVAIIGRGTER